MKRLQIQDVFNALKKIAERDGPFEMGMAVARNMRALQAEGEDANIATAPKFKGMAAWAERRLQLLEAMTDGVPNDRVVIERIEAKMKGEFPDVWQSVQDHNAKVLEFLDQDIASKLQPLKAEWFESLEVSASELEPLLDLFTDYDPQNP